MTRLAAAAAQSVAAGQGLEAAEQVIRAGLLRLGAGMLEDLLAIDAGYAGPRIGWTTRPLAASRRLNPAYTSQRCSACGCVDPKSRESQAGFRCTACDYTCNADVNAARNIAAGHAVNARRGDRVAGPAKREPQELLLAG